MRSATWRSTASTWPRSSGSPPTPSRRRPRSGSCRSSVKDEGITTVFSEPLKPALGTGMATDLGLTNGVLDPIEGLSKATSKEDYLSLMQANLKALQTANGCR
ncbi:zinc ABC transporter substrate-binding protein [Nocardioides sp. W3-2-3]|nr:zinc ABC transporter substrate-binding protein [Nocardioides convexus]